MYCKPSEQRGDGEDDDDGDEDDSKEDAATEENDTSGVLVNGRDARKGGGKRERAVEAARA